jgi:hypothetical protein
MTTPLCPEALTKAQEALTSHLNSWCNKHSLSPGMALNLLRTQVQKMEAKARPKPSKKARKPQPVPVVVTRPRSIDDERKAQEMEGRARAALDAEASL